MLQNLENSKVTPAVTVKTPPYLLQSPTLKHLCWCHSLRALGEVLSMGSKTGNPWAIKPFWLFTLALKQWLEGEEELMYCCFYPLMGTTLNVIMDSRAPRCLFPEIVQVNFMVLWLPSLPKAPLSPIYNWGREILK